MPAGPRKSRLPTKENFCIFTPGSPVKHRFPLGLVAAKDQNQTICMSRVVAIYPQSVLEAYEMCHVPSASTGGEYRKHKYEYTTSFGQKLTAF